MQAIHDYIAIDSKTYASRFMKSLIKAAIKLEKMPRCGRIVPGIGKEDRKRESSNANLLDACFRRHDILLMYFLVTTSHGAG